MSAAAMLFRVVLSFLVEVPDHRDEANLRPAPERRLSTRWRFPPNGSHRELTANAQRRRSRSRDGVGVTPTKPQVLVVDDEASIVDAVATALRYEGFEVREAVTGRAALAAAQDNPPDLVVLDVMLPDLDGLEVTRRLRAD